MPFLSQAQRGFMYANHPDIAKRWERLTPKGQELPAQHGTSSEESPNPKIQKLPRKSEQKRDYGMLAPSSKSRFKISGPANEKESSEEWGVEAHTGSRPGKMHLKSKNLLEPLAKRDVAIATRKKV